MHDAHKRIEQAIVGLVVVAIAVDVLASELPRLMPYCVGLAVIFIILRIVLYHTREW